MATGGATGAAGATGATARVAGLATGAGLGVRGGAVNVGLAGENRPLKKSPIPFRLLFKKLSTWSNMPGEVALLEAETAARAGPTTTAVRAVIAETVTANFLNHLSFMAVALGFIIVF